VITRHHISLAIGSIIILYFPLIAIHPSVFIALGTGVCAGVVVPDIQMKKPRQIRAIYFAWAIIQIFKRTILRLYVCLYRTILGIYPMSDDKRLTHSLPGLFFIAGLIGIIILCSSWMFPDSYPVHVMKIFLAGIVMGILLHFLEDICTKKGLCPFYPFNESYRISGSIRPCDKSDSRIRLFHIQMGIVIIGILLFYYTGFCPGYLKWPMSIATLCVCIVMMLYHADVRIDSENSVDSIKFHAGTGESM
jgi:membrane-bound metal-dependent hydrolase YbcI (DUF457 family)